MYYQVLCAVILFIGVSRVECQADLSTSYTMDKQSLEDKALFLADALVQHPDLFRKLLKIMDAGTPLLDIGGHDPNVVFIKEYFLDMLPEILNSSDNAGILNILADELHRVDVSDIEADLQRRKLSVHDPEARKEFLNAIITRYNKMRALRRVLSHRSVREYLPLTHNDSISASCYNDMMNFIDAIPGIQYPPRQNLNYSSMPWAMEMLDAYGKPPSGILEGDLDWEGGIGECQKVDAHMEPGVILGNRTLISPVNFKGKFCQVTFSILPTIVKFLSTFQKNLDSLRLGMCVPDSCSDLDVTSIFKLGVLKRLNMIPTAVNCLGKNTATATKNSAPSGENYVTSSALFQHFNVCAGSDGSVSRPQWQNCIFSRFDADKNGIISKLEWAALDGRDTSARYFLQMDINHDLQIDSSDLDFFYNFFDNNGNGKIDETEFTFNWKSLFWTVPPSTRESTHNLVTSPVLYQLFNVCDSDSKGLNRDTWIHCFFSKFDTNKNFAIDKAEWTIVDSRDGLARFFLLTDINKDLHIDSKDLIYFFSIYDDNGDGLITLQEFTWNWKSIMWY